MKEDTVKLYGAKTSACPDETTLSAFLSGKLGDAEAKAVEEHAAGCPLCLESIRAAYIGEKLAAGRVAPEPPAEIIRKAKGIAKMNMNVNRFKANLWLAATVVTFMLSFVSREYFAQFLVAALVLGLKWVSESESIRTLIVAMDAKRRHEEKEGSCRWKR